MSCNFCQTKFSFFTKDVGCPSCGFSCCNKCLKFKYNIPDVGVKKVCGPCFFKSSQERENSLVEAIKTMNDASTSDATKEPLAPIEITMKLDLLENPAKPPVVMYKNTSHWDKFKKGLEPVDQEIVDRLQKLKDEERNFPLPSDEEITKRLALLKDHDPEINRNSNNYCMQFFKKEPPPDYEENVTKKLIAKAIAEAKYEQEQEPEDTEATDSEVSHDSEDECVMCEQTADLVQCTGCADDLYCPKCFKDYHADFELEKHKTTRFQPTKNLD